MDRETAALTQNKVKHLYSAASALTASPLSNILKSYYLTKCRMVTLSGSVVLPQSFSKSTVRCPRCCIQYEDGPVTFKILPCKKNRFVRRLLKRKANGENLTRYQNIYLKNLTRKEDVDTHNTLVITCGICKGEAKEKLKKPEQLNNETIEQSTAEEFSKSRKKKKKKDRFSGLDKTAVLSATPQNNRRNTNNFMPLEVTPLTKIDVKKDTGHKKNSFCKNQQYSNDNRNSGTVKKKGNEIKVKQKSRKGLSNILNDSKPSKSPSTNLKLFLTSI